MPLTALEIATCFALAALLTTSVCLPVAFLLLKTTGVPATYPPLLPLQIVSGTVGGSLLVALGYGLLTLILPHGKMLTTVFVSLGALLLVASFHLPYRLSYTKSARFVGVTSAAQIGQGVLHTIVVILSMACFLYR